MQQFLDSGEPGRVTIAVDHREDVFFDELFKSNDAHVRRLALEVGDFLCSARLVVERKSRSDFEQSVIDGRLFSQLPNLVSNYERAVIIVEGEAEDGRLQRSSLLGAYSSIVADFGASLLFTKSKEETAELVFAFAKHEQLAKKQPMRIYARKKTFTPSQSCRAIVETFPMIGPKSAKALLGHFSTVEAIVNAGEKEIASVPGIGKKRAKMIKSTLRYSYDEEDDR